RRSGATPCAPGTLRRSFHGPENNDPARRRGRRYGKMCRASKRPDVGRGRSLGARLDRELPLLPLGQRLEAAALDSRMMYEHVLAAVARADETVALGVVEPLHGSCRHKKYLDKR